jgi:hypothetical protein
LERLSPLLPRFAFTPGSSLTRVIENTSALERTIRKCRRQGTMTSKKRDLTDHQTELPQEYLELEKRIDQLKATHLKLLNVTYIPHIPPHLIPQCDLRQ